MGSLLNEIRAHEAVIWWLTAISVLTFVGSLIAIPWLVVRIPPDYFLHRRSLLELGNSSHLLLRWCVVVAKNVIGLLFVLAGIAMLLLPGQGIITMLVGLMLLDFPGKFALERWLIERPAVLRTINWIRAKAHVPALRSPDPPKGR